MADRPATADDAVNGRAATGSAERLGALDFVRGIAVLGIFVINIESFAFDAPFSPWRSGFETEVDTQFRFWTYVLFQGKFFSLFAMLFGVGFFLFLQRAGRFGAVAVDVYAHRMLWLFVFGALHAILIWPGDILLHYAVCGLLLLPARSLRPVWLALGIAAIAALIAWQSVEETRQVRDRQSTYEAARSVPEEQRSPAQAKTVADWERRYSPREPMPPDPESPRLGGYFDNLSANFAERRLLEGGVFFGSILHRTLMLMLLGILLYRTGVFTAPDRIRGYWAISVSLLLLGLGANYRGHHAWTFEYFLPQTNYLQELAFGFSKELLALGYLLVFNGLYHAARKRTLFEPLCCVGRLALTNYLFQSVLAAALFYGYGLGLHGSLARSELWPIVLAVWAVQLVASVLWLRRFRQGPMEALWRRLMLRSARVGPVRETGRSDQERER